MKKMGRPKTDEKLVREILEYKARNSHHTNLLIAEKFGVHRNTVSRIFKKNKEEIKRLKERRSCWVELDNEVLKRVKIYAIRNDINPREAIALMVEAGLSVYGA